MLERANVENAKSAAETILALEKTIAQAQWSRVESRDATKSYNKMSISDASKLTGTFDLETYFTASGVDSTDIIVGQPSYFEKFASIYSDTDLDTWKNYLKFHFVNNYARLLNKDLVNLNFDFYSTTLRGVKEQAPLWKKTVDASNSVLGEILGKVYVKENFPPEAKARMEELVDNVILGYGVAIENLEWMSPETKLAAKESIYMVHLPMEAQTFDAEEPMTLRVSDSELRIARIIKDIKKISNTILFYIKFFNRGCPLYF